MVPDKFNMVDMGGIDLIMMQGEAVPGLYEKLMEAISNCRYQCLYNWMFDGVLIPPTYVQIENDDDEVFLNEGVSVTSDDVIHIYSVEPAPVDPEIIPLLAEENGVYNVPTGKDGFNPVTVDVPSYTPVIISLTVAENGIYNPPAGVDGYAPVTVNVSGESEYLVIPIMTGSSAPYGSVSSSSQISGQFSNYMAFNGVQVSANMQNGWLADAGDTSPFLRYDFVAPKHLNHVTIFTANNSTTVFRDVYLEGYSNGEWENCLNSGESIELEFRNGTNGNTCLEYNIPLNGNSYDSFRIRGIQAFYGGINQYACTFSAIFMYGY